MSKAFYPYMYQLKGKVRHKPNFQFMFSILITLSKIYKGFIHKSRSPHVEKLLPIYVPVYRINMT